MEAIEPIIKKAFPELPVPQPFFVDAEALRQDMAEELASRIQGRAWTSLSMLDWRMVGSVPAFRGLIVPSTFAYYVPSLLVGVMLEPEFHDWAFEAILPSNRRREPRGEWWAGFTAAITDPQRNAIAAWLTLQKEAVARSSDPVDEELVSAAGDIWA